MTRHIKPDIPRPWHPDDDEEPDEFEVRLSIIEMKLEQIERLLMHQQVIAPN